MPIVGYWLEMAVVVLAVGFVTQSEADRGMGMGESVQKILGELEGKACLWSFVQLGV